MEEWRFEPARDLGLSGKQRRFSLRREVGLESVISCFAWRAVTRSYLALAHRLEIKGRENLPAQTPFLFVANHASHLDAIILGAILPARFIGAVFPIAAGDTFFTRRASSIFATACMNALPLWRKNCGAHSLEELRERLLNHGPVYILFPEGTRTRTGEMARFKPGLGRLVNKSARRAGLPAWHIRSAAFLRSFSSLEKNQGDDWRTSSVCGDKERSRRLGGNCRANGSCNSRARAIGQPDWYPGDRLRSPCWTGDYAASLTASLCPRILIVC